MTIGEKIKRIRKFRNFTQRQLGTALGFAESTADVRVAQYESGTRTPKEKTLKKMATALQVGHINFTESEFGSNVHIMQILMWMEEKRPGLYDSIKYEYNSIEFENDISRYPLKIHFEDNTLNIYLQEWINRKHELKAGVITYDEYFEWKLNWPQTCDGFC